MRLIVLDTNVIISAGIKPGGAPARLVMGWVLEGQIQVAACPAIINEYRKVAMRSKFRRYGYPPMWLEFLISESLQLPDPEETMQQGPDPNDFPFIALAQITGAWLVTGNLKHFSAVPRCVRVLSPADYLKHLGDE